MRRRGYIWVFFLFSAPVWAQTNGGANQVDLLSQYGSGQLAGDIGKLQTEIAQLKRDLQTLQNANPPDQGAITKKQGEIDAKEAELARKIAAKNFFDQQAAQAQKSANHNSQGDGKKSPMPQKPEEKKEEKPEKKEPKATEFAQYKPPDVKLPQEVKDEFNAGGGNSRGATQTASKQGNAQKNLTATQSEINERRLAQAQADSTATQTNNLVAMKKQIDGIQGNLDSKVRPANDPPKTTIGDKLLFASTGPSEGAASRTVANFGNVSSTVRAVMNDHAEARAVANYLQQSNHLARGSFPR